MIDRWIQSFDEAKISAVVALHMSAAFDLVDKKILLNKLRAFKLDPSAISWIDSYLSGRKQQVYIDGCLSQELPVTIGVPQGSILGPLMYIIYTSDLPQSIHDDHTANVVSGFDVECSDCGFISCYADDSTYTISGHNAQHLSEQIEDKYRSIHSYLYGKQSSSTQFRQNPPTNNGFIP